MECEEHYNLKDTEYSDLKSLSGNQYQRLLEAKRIRQGSAEQNQHSEQCLSIPDDGFDVNKHGVHLKPCYKKFTLIISSDRKRKSKPPTRTSKRKRTDEASSSTLGIFPKVCFVCKQSRKTIKKKIYYPYIITESKTEQKIKDVAELKNDHDILTEIRGVDLIPKELMTHKQCYIDYTRCISEKTNSVDEDKAEITFGNYEAVKVFVNDAIIDRCNAVSMRKLLELYGTGFGQENEKKYRNKLKMKLVKEFGDSLTFLKIDGNKPEVVVSTAGLDSTAVVKEKTAVLKQAAEYIREDILQYAEKLDSPSWPPTSDSLTDQEKDYPSALNEFFTFY